MVSITYDLNGGQYNNSTQDIIEEYEKGTVITVHAAPVREGYTFLYWEGSMYNPGDTYKVTEDHRFVAQWEKNAETDNTDATGSTTAPATSGTQESNTKTPHTGDDANVILWLALLIAAFAIIIILILSRKRREKS